MTPRPGACSQLTSNAMHTSGWDGYGLVGTFLRDRTHPHMFTSSTLVHFQTSPWASESRKVGPRCARAHAYAGTGERNG